MRRILTLAPALVLMATSWIPTATAGTPEDPEVTDPANDARIDVVDIVKAWIEPQDSGGLAVKIQTRGAFPDGSPCARVLANYFLYARFSILGDNLTFPNPTTQLYELRVSAYCATAPTATYTFRLARQSVGACLNCFDSSEPVQGRVSGNTVTLTPTPDQIGLRDGEPYAISGFHAFSRIFVGLAIPVNILDEDRAPNTGFGRPLSLLREIDLAQSGGTTKVREGGPGDNLGVRLTSQPNSDVVVRLTALTPTQLTVSPAEITIAAADWDKTTPITVEAKDDAVVEGVHWGSLVACVDTARSSPEYAAARGRQVNVTILERGSPPAAGANESAFDPGRFVQCQPPALEAIQQEAKIKEAAARSSGSGAAGKDTPALLTGAVLLAIIGSAALRRTRRL